MFTTGHIESVNDEKTKLVNLKKIILFPTQFFLLQFSVSKAPEKCKTHMVQIIVWYLFCG